MTTASAISMNSLAMQQESNVLSVVFSLTSGDPHPEAKLKHVITAVKEKVRSKSEEALLKRLELALMAIELKSHQQGFAVFVSSDRTEVVALNYPACERIVFGEQFALTEALYSSRAYPEYTALLMGASQARMFKGAGRYVSEVKADEPELDHLSHQIKERASLIKSQGSGHGAEALVVQKMQTTMLALLEKNQPAVLIGSEQNLAVQPNSGVNVDELVAAKITGNYDTATAGQIGELAAAAVQSCLKEETERELGRIDQLKHDHKVASGIDELSQVLSEGRVDTLYVEEQIDSVNADAERLASLAIRAKAKVVFLPPGSLQSYTGIAAALRY